MRRVSRIGHHRGVTSKRVGLFVIVTVVFMLSLDVTMLDVVLTDIGRAIGASASQLAWLADCYNVAMAGLLLLGAGLGGRYGQRRVFLVGLMIFGIGTLAASLSSAPETLIASRTMMGVGAAGLAAPSLALTGEMFAGPERTRALASWAAASGIGLAVGPILGGVIMSVAGWRGTFLALVPFVVLAFVLGRASLPATRSQSPVNLDVLGAVLSAFALIPLVAALLQVPELGWSDPYVLAGIALGLVLLAAFVVHESRSPTPMIDVSVMRTPMVASSGLALAAAYIGFLGLQFLGAVQLRSNFDLSPVQAGLALAPWALLYWAGARLGAHLAHRVGAMRIVLSGLAILVTAFTWLAVLSHLGPAWVSVGLAAAGVGCGLVTPVAVSSMMSATPEDLIATSSGLSMLARFGGGAVGMAILASAAAIGASTSWGYAAGAVLVLGLSLGSAFLGRDDSRAKTRS